MTGIRSGETDSPSATLPGLTGSTKPPDSAPPCAIVADKLVVSFDRFTLGPVDLAIPEGARIALLGENGAGKSTLLASLAGRVLDYRGSIVLGNDELRAVLPEARARIGVLPERVVAYDWMTVEQYLRLHAQFFDGWDRAVEARLLDRLGVDPRALMQKLSKGTRVKVAFIAAVAPSPRLLLLDEPTSGLDPLVRDVLLACIREYLDADPRRTLIFSTHILEDVAAVATRVLIVRRGRLTLDTPLDRLATSGQPLLDTLRSRLRDA